MNNKKFLNRGNTNATIIAVIAVLGLLAVLAYTFYSNSKTKITVNVGDNSIDMELDNSQLKAVEILNLLFNEQNRKRETQALLKEFHNVYYAYDPLITEELAKLKGDEDVAQKLRELLSDLQGPFHRKYHKFYNIEDKSIIDAIEKLGYDHQVSSALRDLMVHAKGPFKEIAKPMRFSVPGGNRIQVGKGASCRSNPYFRRTVKIFDQTKTRMADIIVEQSFDCPVSNDTEESELIDLIQISFQDMKKLVGDAAIPKFEPGFAKFE
ncbi:hypothetical protein [Alcanivorax sp. 97CO-6]|nr:hypothetical protein [Alcanivorax sp. 97CO-6]